jgi:ATP-dependent helicase HepA
MAALKLRGKVGVVAQRFVRAGGGFAGYGVGKLLSLGQETGEVEYFHSPIDDRPVFAVPRALLQLVDLTAETRIYWRDPRGSAWRVGRVQDGIGDPIAVRFPNGDDRVLHTSDLFVRWNRPIADPTPFLAHRLNETPLFSDARSGFVQAMVEQRAACQGMPALLSSVVELEAHQVDVVRRVLQDPMQRYLLADEVGLGKTIEAGVVIRQYVLDDADHRVVVLVPPGLVMQWRDELRRRFLLGVELGRSVLVLSWDDLGRLAQELPRAGMLVVDEAHHLAADERLYGLVRSSALAIGRLLLLSATPVLRNERGFLRMLHLIDPLGAPLEAEEAFRRRVEHRQVVAEAVAGLIPENLFQLDDLVARLPSLFPGDNLLLDHVEALSAVLMELPEEEDERFLNALSALRVHLSEAYRLNRRILRNRRSGVCGLTPERAGVVFVEYRCAATSRLAARLDTWRDTAALAAQRTDLAGLLAARLAELAESALCRCEPLAGYAVAITPALPILEPATFAAALESRMEALSEAILAYASANTKFIVFCSEPAIADRVVAWLGATRAQGGDGDSDAAALARFLDDPSQRVLICDRRAEEGLNLQGGSKVLVHFDLPLAPNRIEQRMGRLDRYGSGSAVRSIVLRCLDDPLEMAWSACLAEGFGVFNRSIASLQYLVEAEMQALSGRMLETGAEAIQELTERLGGPEGEVANELRRIDAQDALDSLAAPSSAVHERLLEVDGEWQEMREHVERWLVATLHMSREEGPPMGPLPPSDSVFRFGLVRNGNRRSLIPLDRFVETMLPALDAQAPRASAGRPLSFPYTYRRQTALSRRGRAEGVRLLRRGEAFLQGIETLTDRDDRGRCFAMWRQLPGYRAREGCDVFFRFDFVVEVEVAGATDLWLPNFLPTDDADLLAQRRRLASAALQRRGDSAMPPFFHRVWLDAEFEPVGDMALRARLELPYNKDGRGDGGRDWNLNAQRWAALSALRLPVLTAWEAVVRRARGAAEEAMEAAAEIEARARAAVAGARRLDEERFAQLQTRIARGGPGAGADHELLDIEMRVAQALYAGMSRPHRTLDTIGAIFLTDRAWRGPAGPDA